MCLTSQLLRITVAGLALLALPSMASAQGCLALAQGGIYDYKSASFDSEHVSSFIDWLRTHQSSTYQQAKSEGFGLSVPIDDVLIGANYSKDESGFSQFKNDIDSYHSASKSSKTKIATYAKTINAAVIAAIEKCMARRGLKVWLESTPNPAVFKLAANFVNDGRPYHATIRSVAFRNAHCGKEISMGTIVDVEVRAICDRDPSKAVVVVVNADKNPIEGNDLTLNAINPAPPQITGTWKGTWSNSAGDSKVENHISLMGKTLVVWEQNLQGPYPREKVENAKFNDGTGVFSYVQGTKCGNAVRLVLVDGINGRGMELIGKAFPAVKDALENCTTHTFEWDKPNYNIQLSK